MDQATVINKTTITEQVFQALRQAILSNEIPSGEKLTDTELADQFSISRTPVREAIRMLEAEGLVERKPYGNVVVAQRTLEDMINAFHVRIALESYAARLAAELITDDQLERLSAVCTQLDAMARAGDRQGLKKWGNEFHMQIMAVPANDRIVEIITEINDHIHIYRERIYSSPEHIQANEIDHWQILEALKERNADLTQRLMREHLTQALQIIAAIWKQD